jgi:hypothetical protein
MEVSTYCLHPIRKGGYLRQDRCTWAELRQNISTTVKCLLLTLYDIAVKLKINMVVIFFWYVYL